jgi:excisionase family DNA binding protein
MADQGSERIAYSPREAAAASSLSVRKLMAAIADGHLKSYRKGRRRLIFREDLERYLRNEQP